MKTKQWVSNRLRARRVRQFRLALTDRELVQFHADMVDGMHSMAPVPVCLGDSAVAGMVHEQQLWLDSTGLSRP